MKARRSCGPSVPGLGELQGWLFDRVTEPQVSLEGTEGARKRVAELVMAGRLAASARVEVYRHGYFARLIECLTDDYPALRHALGEDRFEALCRDFVERHPPPSPSLNYYGAPFAEYCRARREAWSAFAGDLAQLEWALVEAIHAEEGARLDIAALAGLSPEDWSRVRLLPSPALRLVYSAYPVAEFYQSFAEQDDAQRAPSEGVELPEPRASAVAVCRREETIWRIPLRLALARVLEALRTGTPLLRALDELGGSAVTQAGAAGAGGVDTGGARGASPEELQRAFQDWVACGLFSEIEL